MAIHHAVIKRAEKAGVVLTEEGKDSYKAHWTKMNKVLYGESAKHLLDDIITYQTVLQDWPSMKITIDEDQRDVTIFVRELDLEFKGRATDTFNKAKKAWMDARSELDIEDEEADEEQQRENEEAKAEELEEETPDGVGSVVKQKYRARYKESGRFGVGSGDWLDTVLTNLCSNKEGINIDTFELICKVNGVDTSKYKHEGHGWQGRLRMTGRNLLAKQVYFSRELMVPIHMGVGVPVEGTDLAMIKAPTDWLDTKNYKAAKVIAPNDEKADA